MTVRADDLSLLGDLAGQSCWSAAAGLRRDWLIVLDLGERVRRSLRLANPVLSFQQRTYEGSHNVVVEGCWRLDGPDRVIATCLDVRAPNDRIEAALKELHGRTLTAARAEPPAHDLVLEFDGNFVLRAFVLEPLPAPATSVPEGERLPPPPPPPRCCWTVWTPRGTVMAGPHGRLGDPKRPLGPPSPSPRLSLVKEDSEHE